jgi:acyl-CoA reductase-like NAD-dependent aldehyde dehydrogenase
VDPTILRHRGDFLWGSFFQTAPDGFVESVDPSTGVALDRVPFRTASIGCAVTDARKAVRSWGGALPRQRAQLLLRVREALEARRGGLATLIAREIGKPLWEATLECAAAERAVELIVELGLVELEGTVHPSVFGGVVRLPVGVVAALTPCPYPVYAPIQILLPCLLGGNAVIWKPSSRAPLVSQRLMEAFDAARVPAGALSMVQGPRDPIGAALLDAEVDLLVGAGSAAFADEARARSASRRACSVQSGGKGWAIVCADADLDRAAYEVVSGAYLTAGPRCNATSRLLVERSVARPLLKRVVALMGGLRIAPPSDRESFCGPLVSTSAKTRFDSVLKEWARAGVEFAVDGGSGHLPQNLRRKGQAYAAPALALLEHGELPPAITPPEDVEGPLLLAELVETAEEATDRFNAHPYGLAASVFTESEPRFQGLASRLRAGAVNWNRGTIVASARFPNPGLGKSGFGAESNVALLRSSTFAQSRLGTSGRFDPSHRVPGMAWPAEMGVPDPTSAATPPYRPGEP